MARAPFDRPLMTALSVMIAAAGAGFLSTAFVLGTAPDEEEFRFAILSTFLHVQGLLHGGSVWWTPVLGLGIPLPLSPNFNGHPLVPLLAVLTPVTWARLLLVMHTALGAAGMWRLAQSLGITPLTRSVCVLTFLLATPAQNYTLTDFWPSHFIVWTSSPWLLWLALSVLAGRGVVWRRAVALGLALGLVVASTNPGHAVVYATLTASVLAARARSLFVRWLPLTGALAIALAIASPNAIQLAQERMQFDPSMNQSSVDDPLPVGAARQAVLTPFTPTSEAMVTPFSRTLFFGGPFTVLCLIGCALYARRHTEFVLTVLASGSLLFTTLTVVPFVSARFQFRDPLILTAIPLAGLVVDRLFAHRRTAPIAAAVLTLQAGVMIWTALPFVRGTWNEEGRAAFAFRGATASHETVDRLIALMPGSGRMALTPDVDRYVVSRGGLNDGLGINALAYRDVPVLNGWIKGVSTGGIWPDDRLFYGRIRVPEQAIVADAALDVLGVRYVLGKQGEAVAAGLRVVGEIPSSADTPLVLYENPDRWPEAFLIDGADSSLDLQRVDGCPHPVVLCGNFEALVHRRLDTPLRVRQRGGELDVRILRAPVSRLLVVTQMFRPAWVATSDDGRLQTERLFGGLLGVHVPPGVDRIELRYRPVSLVVATMVSAIMVVASLLALAIGRRRPMRLPAADAASQD